MVAPANLMHFFWFSKRSFMIVLQKSIAKNFEGGNRLNKCY